MPDETNNENGIGPSITDYTPSVPTTSTTAEQEGTGKRVPEPGPAPAPKPLPPRPAPAPYVPPKPPPRPAFMTPLRWGILGVLVVGAGVAAWELTPKSKARR